MQIAVMAGLVSGAIHRRPAPSALVAEGSGGRLVGSDVSEQGSAPLAATRATSALPHGERVPAPDGRDQPGHDGGGLAA